jgi:serine/threonine-protein kinase
MRRLFKRETDIATLMAIRDAVIPDVRTLAKEYPEPLYTILMRALEQDPDQRYQTAEELRAELDAFVGSASERMHHELARLVSRLFPGEELKYSRWHRGTIQQPVLATAPPPPMPVPIASSNLLIEDAPLVDDAEIEIIEITK